MERCVVSKALQSGSIVRINGVFDEGVSVLVIGEAVSAGVVAVWRYGPDRLCEPAIKALDHAVGLGRVGARQLVANAVGCADAVKGGRPVPAGLAPQ